MPAKKKSSRNVSKLSRNVKNNQRRSKRVSQKKRDRRASRKQRGGCITKIVLPTKEENAAFMAHNLTSLGLKSSCRCKKNDWQHNWYGTIKEDKRKCKYCELKNTYGDWAGNCYTFSKFRF